jgi:hypothetical protein
VIDPKPSDWVRGLGVHLNQDLPADPAIVLIAVKPQMMGQALPTLQALGNGTTLFLSVAAGTPIRAFQSVLGSQTPIIRAMPNTPAAVGKGITAENLIALLFFLGITRVADNLLRYSREEAWLAKFILNDTAELDELMDAEAYANLERDH